MVDHLEFMDDSNSLIQVWEDWGDKYAWGWWVAVPPSDLPPKSILVVWGISTMGQPNECQILPWILHPGSHLGKVDLGYCVQAVTLRRMTHQDLPPLKAGSSSGCGTRWPLTWWTGSRSISHIRGPTCNAPSLSGWWWCPHFAPLSCTRDSGWPH